MSHLSSLSSFCHCMWLTLCTSILFDKHDIVSSYSSTNSTSNFMNIRIHVFVNNSYTEYRPIRLKYTRSFIKKINGSNLQFFKWFRIKIWSKKKKIQPIKKVHALSIWEEYHFQRIYGYCIFFYSCVHVNVKIFSTSI